MSRAGDRARPHARLRPAPAPPGPLRHRRLPRLLLALTAASSLAACNGDNLFDGAAQTQPPAITGVAFVADAVTAGDTVTLTMAASGSEPISSFAVSFAGAFSADTIVELDSPAIVASADLRVAVPIAVVDTLLSAVVTAVDAAGGRSVSQSATIRVVGPPVVSSVLPPPTAVSRRRYPRRST